MSVRATRPRSRRGRPAPPGELDPVAESSEEAEAAGSNTRRSADAVREEARPQPLEPGAEASDQGLGDGADGDPDGDAGGVPCPEGPQEPPAAAQQPPEADPADGGAEPTGPGAPDVFHTLQQALSSLEAAAAAWRLKTPHTFQVQELQETLRRVRSSPPGSPGGPGSDSSSSGADTEPWGARGSSSVSSLLRLRDSSSQILGPVSMPVCGPAEKLLEGRVEQLHGNMEKLKCFNRLLLAALRGWKGRCEELSLHVGRRAAEATALGLALHYSESCEAAYGALLALREADPARRTPRPKAELQRAAEEARRLLAAVDGGTPPHSPEGSSADKPRPQEVATQLQAHIQRLQERRALLKIPEPSPSAAARLTAPHGEAMVQAILETQPSPALPQLEKTQIQQGLMATRETLADLMLQLQLVRREKRGLELREAALRAQGPAHVLLLEQLQWERPVPWGTPPAGSPPARGPFGLALPVPGSWQPGLPARGRALPRPASPTRPCASFPGSLSTQCPTRTPVTSWPRPQPEFTSSWKPPGWLRPELPPRRFRALLRVRAEAPSSTLLPAGPPASLAVSPQGLPALPGGEEGRDPQKLSQELAASLARSRGLRQQLQSLRERLEQMARRGRASRAQSAELHRDLCRAHSALVLAFRGAHRKQEEQRRKLEQQLARLEARQAGELARLEAATPSRTLPTAADPEPSIQKVLGPGTLHPAPEGSPPP
ncbi:PREDICTED: Usher syndrome type-1C protein-binding protein 1 [Dipodomys ordii]|uniref:Usher syndrome type-1C protein-binding protein 1 n=1 Tax=Dipodomys ordii TaxID=10020 RepID=A0A1S3G4Z8_DIPOR|nr:PREDICTED: Usher syndrome type-1C protein-binding protein 1 [Dipodomys ordii]